MNTTVKKLPVRHLCEVIVTFREGVEPSQHVGQMYVDLSSRKKCWEDVFTCVLLISGDEQATSIVKVSLAVLDYAESDAKIGHWFMNENGKIYIDDNGNIEQ